MSAHPCYTSDLVGLHDRGHAWAGFPELLHPKEAATFEDHSSSIGLCGIRVWGAFQAQVIRLIGEVGCGCKFLGNMSTVDASGVLHWPCLCAQRGPIPGSALTPHMHAAAWACTCTCSCAQRGPVPGSALTPHMHAAAWACTRICTDPDHAHTQVLSNMSLSMNSVGLYQILKIGTAPTVVLLEFILYRHVPSRLMLCSVVVTRAQQAHAVLYGSGGCWDRRLPKALNSA
eukprot:1159696-Pelagomonas_calceolata.AAC.10